MKLFKLFLLLAMAFAFWCFGQEFVVNKPVHPRKSLAQTRQEIVETLADLIQSESKNIEMRARVQQDLYKHIESIIQVDKKSVFATADRAQLNAFLQKFKKRKNDADNEIEQLKNFIGSLNLEQKK